MPTKGKGSKPERKRLQGEKRGFTDFTELPCYRAIRWGGGYFQTDY